MLGLDYPFHQIIIHESTRESDALPSAEPAEPAESAEPAVDC